MANYDDTPAPRRQGTLLAGVLMACVGWLGLYFLIRDVLPRAGARWVFFVLLYMAVAGTAIPLVKLLNNRFRGSYPEPPDWISVRQSLWIALFVATCAWLQIPRVLNGAIAFFLALSLAVIEIFLRLRERSQHGY